MDIDKINKRWVLVICLIVLSYVFFGGLRGAEGSALAVLLSRFANRPNPHRCLRATLGVSPDRCPDSRTTREKKPAVLYALTRLHWRAAERLPRLGKTVSMAFFIRPDS